MSKEGFVSLQILDSLDEVMKPEERMREYAIRHF